MTRLHAYYGDGFYDDGLIQLDREALTLRRYHFPSGTSKVILLRDIRDYRVSPLGLVVQRFRLWGSSDLRRWLPLDIRRPLRSTLVTLDVAGAYPDPACTPARPEEFLALLARLLGGGEPGDRYPGASTSTPR